MRILFVEPNADPRAIEIDGSLASMQALVGGLIQAVYPFEDPVALICNDEGKLTGLPQNRPLKHPETGEVYDVVYGTFFVCSAPSDSENFESLSDDLLEKYRKIFALPKLVCTDCGEEFPKDELYPFSGELLCPDCLEAKTVLCSHCGERIWRDENAGGESTPLCQDCYDRHYTNCHCCGDIIRISQTYYACESDGNEYPFCYDCYTSRTSRKSIQDYYYKPEPLFRGDGDRFFGVELEVDGAGEDDDNAAEVMSIANGNGIENLYCKHDGSLDDGFEMVTHPMTLAYHQTEMPWAAILRKAVQMGYTSHQAGTCGLHVHVNRAAFGNTESVQDAVIARTLFFFEKFWDELLKFSRRTQGQLNQWAARYGYKDQPQEILDHAKSGRHAGRYTAVNLTNADTIEFRMFRGTLKYNTLIATLELLDCIIDAAIYLTDDDLKAMSWSSFVLGCTQPELMQYLKERRLYVNEPVESEGEV